MFTSEHVTERKLSVLNPWHGVECCSAGQKYDWEALDKDESVSCVPLEELTNGLLSLEVHILHLQ